MDKMQLSLRAEVRPAGSMPSLANALSADGDSTAVRAEYALLISAFDFVCALREIVRAHFPQAPCQIRSASAGCYDVIVRLPERESAAFYAYVRFDEDKDVFTARRLHFAVQYWGEHEAVAAVARKMGERFGQ